MKRLRGILRLSLMLFALAAAALTQVPDPAQAARDRGDLPAMEEAIRKQQDMTTKDPSLENHLRLSVLHDWMCEVAYSVKDNARVKKAAQDGMAAAEKAVQLNPKSSEAHRLLGHHTGNLIPHVFAGGMRYGRRAVTEVEKALQLDPNNAEAYISRAISYHFTPGMFGGSQQKAVEYLQKAVKLNPNSDTARIWLAQVYQEMKKKDDALREINEARRINPERMYAEYLHMVYTGKIKPGTAR